MNKIIQFPKDNLLLCQGCGTPCGIDELSECYQCRQKVCGSASRKCMCACARLEKEMAERIKEELQNEND